MLIAPFSASPSVRVRAVPRSLPRREARPPVGALIAWSIVGLIVVLCVPAARGDRLLGATLPFWLVAAPLIDIAWIRRQRIARSGVELVRRFARRRRMARSVRRQLPLRTAACIAERS